MGIRHFLNVEIYFTHKVSEEVIEKISKEVSRVAESFKEVDEVEIDTGYTIIPEVGMDVFVLAIGGIRLSEPIEGRIVEVTTIYNPMTGEVFIEDEAVIELKNGFKIFGFECLWTVRPCEAEYITCVDCGYAKVCSKKNKGVVDES